MCRENPSPWNFMSGKNLYLYIFYLDSTYVSMYLKNLGPSKISSLGFRTPFPSQAESMESIAMPVQQIGPLTVFAVCHGSMGRCRAANWLFCVLYQFIVLDYSLSDNPKWLGDYHQTYLMPFVIGFRPTFGNFNFFLVHLGVLYLSS